MPWTGEERLQGGKYVIDKVLGQGGFGITYKALHVELNQTVVIKTPIDTLSRDPEYDKYIKRFIQEAQILVRLSQEPHPHIVGVIDKFMEGTTHCLVMDFVLGENLFEAVKRRGALPEVEIVPCICQIGEALTVVHQAGLVHRDAHPGNIMLRSNGKAVLIDFGIAKGLTPTTLTSKGNVGNHGFAPYEQIHGGSWEPTVDVYCLAATLYYAVTGQKPTDSLTRKLNLDDVPLIPPKQIISGISDQLNQAILNGMELEAKDRPQSMQAWLAMLEEPKATPPPPVAPVHRQEVVCSKAKPKATSHKAATKSPDHPQSIPRVEPVHIAFPDLVRYIFKATNLVRKYLGVPWLLRKHFRKEVVRSKAKLNLESIPVKPATKSIRTIPWSWLAAMLFCYVLTGYFLGLFNAPLWAIAVAMAVAAVGAAVGAGWAGVVTVFKIVFFGTIIVWVLVMALAHVVVGPEYLTMVVVVAAVVAMAVVVAVSGGGTLVRAGYKLQQSFSKFHTFLILAGTCFLGLDLGWVLGRILAP